MTQLANQDTTSDSASTREVLRLLTTYAQSHQHPSNEKIHFICVPAIVWTLLGLLWYLHPALALASAALALLYYIKLSLPFAIGMALMSGSMLAILSIIPHALLLNLSIAVFVVAWIFQFIGHKIEGKKPSFFEDLRYLLVGPLFVLSFLYRRLNIKY